MKLVVDVHAEEPIDDEVHARATPMQRIAFEALVKQAIHRFFAENFEDGAVIEINVAIKEDAE
nr:hypothetical protein [Paenibacillus xylanexedens]